MPHPETYRRVRVHRFGGPEALTVQSAPLEPPAPGQVRIRVLAAGVGLTDVMARDGDYVLQRRLPFTPGYEAVGVVDRAGTGARPAGGPPPGTLVAVALTHMGAYGEYLTVPGHLAVPLPAGLDPVTAAAIPLDYLTALSVLDSHARVRPGQTVLVHGASGGVGQALSQLGALRGLRMIGTASAAGSRAILEGNGVEFVDYRAEDFEAAVRRRAPDGVDAVFDHIGGAYVAKNLRLLRRGGVLVNYAFAGRPGHMVGDTVRGAARLTLSGLSPARRTALCTLPRQIRRDPAWYRHGLDTLLELARDGRIRPRVAAVLPLTSAGEAHRLLASRTAPGKIVLVTDESPADGVNGAGS